MTTIFRQWEPPPSFVARFREHIRPRLELRLTAAALDVVLGLDSYSNRWGDLWFFAWFRGASFLSTEMALDLEQWLHRRLIEEIDRIEAESREETATVSDRLEVADAD